MGSSLVRIRTQPRDALVLVSSLAAVGAAVALLRQMPGVNETTVGFVLLLIVLSTASVASVWVAVSVAVAGTLALNFFFLPPIGTFTIAEPQNWIALAAFLTAAVIASNLSAAATERTRIAIERAQFLQEREAAELERQRGELASTLLASLSHDVKTPLTAIRVAVENLRDDLPGEQRRAQAEAAVTELLRLTRLFEDILDMARIDAAAIHVQREWVTPADIVDAALAHAMAGHAVRVDADGDRVVNVDARLASVALSHLIENAARYSPADRAIVIEGRGLPDGFTVSVSDQGPGLDPAEIEQLFERFYRGRHGHQTAPGTGMGLAITRGLLKAVGGRVWAENVTGSGARFSMAVPGATRPLEVDA
jgi:two-component system sensor histidine kinase KdpD